MARRAPRSTIYAAMPALACAIMAFGITLTVMRILEYTDPTMKADTLEPLPPDRDAIALPEPAKKEPPPEVEEGGEKEAEPAGPTEPGPTPKEPAPGPAPGPEDVAPPADDAPKAPPAAPKEEPKEADDVGD